MSREQQRPRLPSPALVVAVLALILALSGTATALRANSVRSQHIVNGQVKAPDLGQGAVKRPKLAEGAVKRAKVASGAVRRAALAPDSVDATKVGSGLTGADLANGAVSGVHFPAASIPAAKIADGSLTDANFNLNAFVGAHFADGSVGLASLGSSSVNSGHVVANSLGGADIDEATLRSPLLRNLSQHTATSPNNTNSVKEAIARCPAGKVIVGGGGRIPNIGGITASYPYTDEGNPGWRVVGSRYQGSSTTSWGLTAIVICAEA